MLSGRGGRCRCGSPAMARPADSGLLPVLVLLERIHPREFMVSAAAGVHGRDA